MNDIISKPYDNLILEKINTDIKRTRMYIYTLLKNI